jgi:hypothetical protein
MDVMFRTNPDSAIQFFIKSPENIRPEEACACRIETRTTSGNIRGMVVYPPRKFFADFD